MSTLIIEENEIYIKHGATQTEIREAVNKRIKTEKSDKRQMELLEVNGESDIIRTKARERRLRYEEHIARLESLL